MITVGQFEKVNFNQFHKDFCDTFPSANHEEESVKSIYDMIQLPRRATVGSAGYDFKSPVSFTLEPGKTIKIPTGVRVKINEGWFLACYPRSGLGFKYRMQLDNTVGIIDADYYHSSNEGHIFLKLTNDGNKTLEVKQGDGIAQGIFQQFGITYDDDASGIRDGGFGSTGR